MAQLIPNPTPVRVFKHQNYYDVAAVAVFSDGRRIVTGSYDKVIRLWDMRKGVVLKKLEGHCYAVKALAVSRDGRLIASGDDSGAFIAWDADIGESLTQAITTHPKSSINSLDFSPDGSMLAICSLRAQTTELWSTKTWERQGNPIELGGANTSTWSSNYTRCVRFSPSGDVLAIAAVSNIQIYNHGTREYIASFKAHSGYNISLAWTPDGARLLSTGGDKDPTVREWDTSTWKQVGDPWKGHFKHIHAISLNSNATLLASASDDNHVRLWRVSDRRTIVSFKHSGPVHCVTFSADDRHILSGGQDCTISEWLLSDDALPEDRSNNGLKDDPKEQATYQAQPRHTFSGGPNEKISERSASEDALPEDGPKDGLMKEQVTHHAQAYSDFKVFAMNPTARDACIAGDFTTAETVLNQEIDADANNYISYAYRAFIMARKSYWNRALLDSIKSVSIQPSFAGHISKGIALCGKKQVRAANTAFDLASVFTNGDVKISHFLFLIKTIALFNANEHEEAMLRVGELAVSPNVDPVVCRIVEAYLRVQLGKIASDGSRYNEAVDHFTLAVNASVFFYNTAIHSTYEEFVVLFGWDLKSLWQTANQQLCEALIRAGRIGAAVESYQSMMDKSDITTKISLRAWFSDLK